jgi:(p)ppGpp synthase/HD superfamily hydrolase
MNHTSHDVLAPYTSEDIAERLSQIILAPYISKATALIGRRRWGGSNMFRHQLDTMTILLDYKFIDSVLLKAACIHDLFEDASGLPGVSRNDIVSIDSEGTRVYDLVMEVTRRENGGKKEPKSEFLKRIMETGSPRAKTLKLADRISNLVSLGFVLDDQFVEDVLTETKECILPHAGKINKDMRREIGDLVADREHKLQMKRDAAIYKQEPPGSDRA